MLRNKLDTETIILALPHLKSRKIFDGAGLYIEISPHGGKWWRFKYRFDGKEKRISLGVFPQVSLKDARRLRDECHFMIANKIDPSKKRKELKELREAAATVRGMKETRIKVLKILKILDKLPPLFIGLD